MLDYMIYSSSIGTAAETALAVVGNASLTVKALPNPRIRSLDALGAGNIQYAKIAGSIFGPMGLTVRPNALQRILMDGKLNPSETLQVFGYQDSGGNEQTSVGVLYQYGPKKTTPSQGIIKGQNVSPTEGTNTWGAYVAMTNLSGNRKYAILGYYAFGATAMGIKFSSPSFFNGCEPGGPAGTDVEQNKMVYFPDDDIPIFDGANGCSVAAFGSGAAAVACTVLLLEF